MSDIRDAAVNKTGGGPPASSQSWTVRRVVCNFQEVKPPQDPSRSGFLLCSCQTPTFSLAHPCPDPHPLESYRTGSHSSARPGPSSSRPHGERSGICSLQLTGSHSKPLAASVTRWACVQGPRPHSSSPGAGQKNLFMSTSRGFQNF